MTPETQKELSESGYDITPIDAETRERLAQDLDAEAYFDFFEIEKKGWKYISTGIL